MVWGSPDVPDVELRDLADFNEDDVDSSSDDEVYPWTAKAAVDIDDSLLESATELTGIAN